MLIVSDITVAINRRFFEALASLKQRKDLGGVNGFCKKYGVSTGNMYTIKNQSNGAIKLDYLYFLVKDYGVSAEWLLTGDGDMFRHTSSRSEQSQSQET